MGLEMTSMDIEELEDILYETDKLNHEDFSTFMEALLDMYGGIQTENYMRLADFMRNEMKLGSDAELAHLTAAQKQQIVEYASKLE